jgi:hypothetical protein
VEFAFLNLLERMASHGPLYAESSKFNLFGNVKPDRKGTRWAVLERRKTRRVGFDEGASFGCHRSGIHL